VHHSINRLFAILTAAVIALGATAAMAQERLEIVATTGMIADAAREVGGDLVRYPHSWVRAWTRMPIARPAAISSRPPMRGSRPVAWALPRSADGRLPARARADPPVVAVADGLPRNLLISHDDYEDRFDPHVWMNPNLWSRVVLEYATR
jgi:manganese/zinc/iron transport system substrate-binding protein